MILNETDANIRMECLRIALQVDPSDVIGRANAYYGWITGKDADATTLRQFVNGRPDRTEND